MIGKTIQQIWHSNYPKSLLEIVVVCHLSDQATIAATEQVIKAIDQPQIRLITFDDGPINKPHGLNVGLAQTQHEIVTIFDAEDDVQPDIFQVINTLFQSEGVSIVQSGVQLMDADSSWYAPHNVVEYYFWFKSQLHYNARFGAVPLAGNTVFIKRSHLEQIGGWDDNCLTEDADIGLRLSLLGVQIVTIYDPEHATREETPASIAAFIKQTHALESGLFTNSGQG